MLGFLMDCLGAGIALTLLFYCFHGVANWPVKPKCGQLVEAVSALTLAVFLFCNFIMSFWIMFSMWE
jgi:hypothetical protein